MTFRNFAAALFVLTTMLLISPKADATIVIATFDSNDVTTNVTQVGAQINALTNGTINSFSGLPFNPTGALISLQVISDTAGIVTGGMFSLTTGSTNYLSGTIASGGYSFVSPFNTGNPTIFFAVNGLSSDAINVFDFMGPISVTLDLVSSPSAGTIIDMLTTANFAGLMHGEFEYSAIEVPFHGVFLLLVIGLAGLIERSRSTRSR
jgi:hypothetical protein